MRISWQLNNQGAVGIAFYALILLLQPLCPQSAKANEQTFDHSDTLSALAFSPRGDMIVSAAGGYVSFPISLNAEDEEKDKKEASERTIKTWSTTTGKLLRTFTVTCETIDSLLFLPNGNLLVVGYKSDEPKGHFWQWNIQSGKLIHHWTRPRSANGVTELYQASPNGDILLEVDTRNTQLYQSAPDGSVATRITKRKPASLNFQLVNTKTSKVLWRKHSRLAENEYYSEATSSFALSQNPYLAIGYGYKVYLYNWRTGQSLGAKRSYSEVITTTLSVDGTKLAAGLLNNTVTVWDMKSDRILGTRGGHKSYVAQTAHGPRIENGIEAVAFAPDRKALASRGADGVVLLWNVQTGKLVKKVGQHNDCYAGFGRNLLRFSSDGKRLASGMAQQIKVWSFK
jgi:WD40 repeat protein